MQRPNPTPAPIRADDAVRFAAAKIRSWLSDDDDEDRGDADQGDQSSTWTRAGASDAALRAVLAVLERVECGDQDHYADGRRVESTAEFLPANSIVRTAHHVWNPDPAAEEPASCGTHSLTTRTAPAAGVAAGTRQRGDRRQ